MLHRNFIAGEWTEGVSVNRNINPSNLDDVVGEYARADALDRVGAEILARKDEIGRLLSREEGKTLPEGAGEVARAGRIFKFFAGEALRVGGERLPSVRAGVDVEAFREPEGVVGVITPWNFPIAIPAWKIAPALAYGNCVVFKPADLAPGSAWMLSEILSRAGLPAGVFNLVMGSGGEVGRRVAADCVARGAKVQLEMGGKNPLIVLDDADLAVAVANDTEFGLSSGICTTSLKYASDFKRRSSAGMVMVNLPTAGVDYHVPFGGRKGSSFGPREMA